MSDIARDPASREASAASGRFWTIKIALVVTIVPAVVLYFFPAPILWISDHPFITYAILFIGLTAPGCFIMTSGLLTAFFETAGVKPDITRPTLDDTHGRSQFADLASVRRNRVWRPSP